MLLPADFFGGRKDQYLALEPLYINYKSRIRNGPSISRFEQKFKIRFSMVNCVVLQIPQSVGTKLVI